MLRGRFLLLTSILSVLLGFWLRWPTLSEGLPYFYREDEAHHFNRLVNMAKARTLDPQYFHKPSLHFYLRLPALAAGVAWNRYRGHLTSVREIETEDPFGLADYRFSASHPGIVKWVRAVSLGLSILIIPLAVLIAAGFGAGPAGALAAGVLSAVSPELIRHASTVGVDTVMAFFVLLSVWLAQRLWDRWSIGGLLLCAAACGLAVSSKYNAAPIAALPVIVTWMRGERSFRMLAAALLLPIAAFLAGSPYILVNLSMFFKHAGYEVWHYAVAGHEDHTGSPGIGQAIFYGRWLGVEAIGWPALVAAVGGFVAVIQRDRRRAAALLWFPLTFFLLMIAQKVNFTRNMIVVIPFVAIGAGILVDRLLWLRSRIRVITAATAISILVIFPLAGAVSYRHELLLTASDTRTQAADWLRQNRETLGDLAIAGELQFEPGVYQGLSAWRVKTAESSTDEMRARGFDAVVAGVGMRFGSGAVLVHEIEGAGAEQRIVSSPEILVFTLSPEIDRALLSHVRNTPGFSIGLAPTGAPEQCPRKGSREDDSCWMLDRVAFLAFAAAPIPRAAQIKFELMSPWPEQEAAIYSADFVELGRIKFGPDQAGIWGSQVISLPAEPIDLSGIFIAAKDVISPASRGISSDHRRLSIAIRKAELIGGEKTK